MKQWYIPKYKEIGWMLQRWEILGKNLLAALIASRL